MCDLSVMLVYLYFFSDLLSEVSFVQFSLGFIPFSVYFFFKVTKLFIQIIGMPLKCVSNFLIFIVPTFPIIIQGTLMFHLLFDCIWNIYLHSIINLFIFLCIPIYSYLFYKAKHEKSIIFMIKKYSKYSLKLIILISIALLSHDFKWYDSIVPIILLEIFHKFGIKKK